MKKRIVSLMFNLFHKRQVKKLHDADGNDCQWRAERFCYMQGYNTNVYITYYVCFLGIIFAKTLTPDCTQFNTIVRKKNFGLKVVDL